MGNEGANAPMSRVSRSVYLDALRAVALVRVVIYHVSGSWLVTAFTAMPLMFFIAGTLYAASLERRPARRVIRDRYRRIMAPYWLYIAAMIGLWWACGTLGQLSAANWVGLIFPVIAPGGPTGPDPTGTLHLTWFALWYVQMHLVLSLIGAPLRRWQRNRPRVLCAGIAVLFAAGAVVAPGVAISMFYVTCWITGYAHHDGRVETWIRPRWKRLCWVLGPIGAVAFFGSGARHLLLAAIGIACLGVFWLALALGCQPRIEPWLAGRRQRSVTTWFSQRSLSIYLRHGAALWAVIEIAPTAGLPARMFGTAALVVLCVVAFGWMEDIAARRPMQLWPRLPSSRDNQVIDLRTPQMQPSETLELDPGS